MAHAERRPPYTAVVDPPLVVIITPALADANNGNWQTASRWAGHLQGRYRVQVASHWDGSDAAMMIALHARRSAPAVAAWKAAHPQRPLALVLTGTDLYRDIDADASARQSLALADRLLVLNELGARVLPEPLRRKVRVCLQSSPGRRTRHKTGRHLRVLMVAHLRDEKSPRTFFDAARRLAHRSDLLFDLVGDALDPALGDEARALAAVQPRFQWLGPLSHAAALGRIQAAHLLVNASRLEGGAHVVIEAVRCGTPVLASRIDGNLGLLGCDYEGYFPAGDAVALAALLERARDDNGFITMLAAQCARRAPLFEPAREREAVRAVVEELLAANAGG